MQEKALGKTGMRVSEFGFGGIPITRLPIAEAADLLRAAYEEGVNLFDTANMYADSEKKIGRALAGVRGKVIIASKTMARDRSGARAHLEQSLRELKSEWIDIYQLHNVSTTEELSAVTARGGAYEALEEARQQGLVRAVGFSSHNLDTAVEACRSGLFETVQVPFNFIEKEAAEKLFPVAQELGMGILAMKPLGGGLLESADLCFGFLQRHPQAIPIPGIQTLAELKEILALYERRPRLGDEQLAAMEHIRKTLGDRFCRRCGYCRPCPQGIEIWQVLLFKAQCRRFPPQMAIKMNRQVMEKAAQCEACGECIQRCPYELPVPELIADAREAFECFCREHAC